MTDMLQRQLSLEIYPHPQLQATKDGRGPVTGSLQIAGALDVNQDLHAGQELMVLVQSADGELLSQHRLEVGQVALIPIKVKDLGVIGTERAHKAKVTE